MASENTLSEMQGLAEAYAKAEAEKQYLMEFRKSEKAILMAEAERENPSLPAVKQERYAYSNPEYLELLEGLKVAIEAAVALRFKIKVIEMRFEQWRSREATRRAEMTLR